MYMLVLSFIIPCNKSHVNVCVYTSVYIYIQLCASIFIVSVKTNCNTICIYVSKKVPVVYKLICER